MASSTSGTSLPRAHFRLPGGGVVSVGPGGIVGRLAGAALRLAEPDVSEAHALVSLRGTALHLLKLRGTLTVRGTPVDGVVLEPTLELMVASVPLRVEDVDLPAALLGVEVGGQRVEVLDAAEVSVFTRPEPWVLREHLPAAPLRLWTTGAGWEARLGPGGTPEAVQAGSRWVVDGVPVRVVEVPLEGAGRTQTVGPGGLVHTALRVEVWRECTRITRQGEDGAVYLWGRPAGILAQLVLFGSATHWEDLAREVWGERDRSDLRENFKAQVQLLRHRLGRERLRTDLVVSLGGGRWSWNLLPGDELLDRTFDVEGAPVGVARE